MLMIKLLRLYLVVVEVNLNCVTAKLHIPIKYM